MALRRLCSSGTYFLCSIEEECTKFIRSPVSADEDDAWATTTTTTFVLHNRVMSDHNGRVPIRRKYLYTGTLCTNRPSDSHRLDSKGKRYSLDSEYIGQLAGLSGQILPLSGKHKHQQWPRQASKVGQFHFYLTPTTNIKPRRIHWAPATRDTYFSISYCNYTGRHIQSNGNLVLTLNFGLNRVNFFSRRDCCLCCAYERRNYHIWRTTERPTNQLTVSLFTFVWARVDINWIELPPPEAT